MEGVPHFLTDNPTPQRHLLVILMDDFDNPFVILLTFHGVASSFPTRKPTMLEEFGSLPHIPHRRGTWPTIHVTPRWLKEHKDALTKAVLATGGGPQHMVLTSTKAPVFSLQTRS